MQVKVLKPFGYSEDGRFTVKKLEGDTFDCRDDLVDDLAKEGYVKKGKADKSPVVEPSVAPAPVPTPEAGAQA